jgi:predicted amidohydrolase
MNDLLIKNGHVIDTVLRIDEIADIAVKNDLITRVGKNLPEKDAAQVVDASGCFVTPGFFDCHVHVNYGSSDFSFRPELGCFPSGVTTCVDAGSAGVATYENFYNTIVASSLVTVKGALNICSLGGNTRPEDLNPEYLEPEKVLRFCKKYKDNIVGIKIRIQRQMIRDYGIGPLKIAAQTAQEARLPLTVHVLDTPLPVKDILAILSPGDVYCHVFHDTGSGISFDPNGRLLPEVWEARKRGILFDAAHGRGSVSFRFVRAALAEGFKPDFITSDISRFSLNRSPAYSFSYILSEFLHFGFTFKDIVKMNTETAFRFIYGMSSNGFIKENAPADLAVFRILEKPVRFTSYKGEILEGNKLIKCEMTIKAGEPVFRQIDFY